MNTKRLNINKILLGVLIFAVSLPAADKNDLKNNEQQNHASATEAIPLGYVAPRLPKVLSLPRPQNRRVDKSLAF